MARSAAEHGPQYRRARSVVPPGAAVNIIVFPGRCFFAGIGADGSHLMLPMSRIVFFMSIFVRLLKF